MCEGYCRELARLLQTQEHKLNVVEEVSSLDMMLTLVGAGYGVGFMTATKIPVSQRPDVVIRPLALDTAVITTYLLRLESSNLIGFAGAIYRPPPGPFERLTQRTAPLKIGHRHEDCVPLHSSALPHLC